MRQEAQAAFRARITKSAASRERNAAYRAALQRRNAARAALQRKYAARTSTVAAEDRVSAADAIKMSVVRAEVKQTLKFARIPLVPGSIRRDIYNRLVSKMAADIQNSTKKPSYITYREIRAQATAYAKQVLSEMGYSSSSSQREDFVPEGGYSGPLKSSQMSTWRSSTYKGRAMWAVKEGLKSMGITYRVRVPVTPEQYNAILPAANKWLDAIAADPVVIRSSGDMITITRAKRYLNTGLLSQMQIFPTKPQAQPDPEPMPVVNAEHPEFPTSEGWRYDPPPGYQEAPGLTLPPPGQSNTPVGHGRGQPPPLLI